MTFTLSKDFNPFAPYRNFNPHIRVCSWILGLILPDLANSKNPSKACQNTIRNNFTKRKYSKYHNIFHNILIKVATKMHIRFKVVILFLTLKLVKQHAIKSQAETTQEKFCNISPHAPWIYHCLLSTTHCTLYPWKSAFFALIYSL